MSRPVTRLQASRTIPMSSSHNQSETETQPVFYQELTDLIIDELEDDAPALATLGLVCRAWNPRTRVHLFRNVCIGGNEKHPPAKDLEALVDLLTRNPYLPLCVRQLRLVNGTRQPPAWLGRLSSGTARGLASLLDLLTSLSSITVLGSAVVRLPDTPSTVQKALYAALGQPGITHLSFERISGLDLGFIASLPNLRSLDLDDVRAVADGTFLSDPSDDSNAPPPLSTLPTLNAPHRLESLDISQCGSALLSLFRPGGGAQPALTNTFYPREITVNASSWNEEMEAAWGIILKTSAPSVERYTVLHDDIFLPTVPFPPSLFNFSPFSASLTELSVVIVHGFTRGPTPADSIPCLVEGLFASAESTGAWSSPRFALRKVKLAFTFPVVRRVGFMQIEETDSVFDVGETLKRFAREAFWSDLSSALVRPAFARLEEVAVIFDVMSRTLSDEDWEDAGKTVLAAMSELDEKGVLWVTKSR